MIRFESSVQIGRPREDVFHLLTDLESIPRWQSEVVQVRPISEGAMRVGYQFEERVKVGPWRLRTVCTVTDLRPAERFAFSARSDGPIDYEGSFELQPVAGGTRLTLSGTARLHGLWRLLQPLLAADVRRGLRSECAALKHLLETEGAESRHGA